MDYRIVYSKKFTVNIISDFLTVNNWYYQYNNNIECFIKYSIIDKLSIIQIKNSIIDIVKYKE